MGPKIYPCGTPKSIFRAYRSFLFSVIEIKDSDFLSKPKAINFAICKLRGMQSKALEISKNRSKNSFVVSNFFHFFHHH